MKLQYVLILALAVAVSGCASSVKQMGGADGPANAAYKTGQQAKSISLTMTPEAQAKLADNLKFNQDTLLSTVRRALEAKSLIAKNASQDAPAIEILVKDIRVRSNFSAVMFGFMAGSDSVTGDVIVKAPDGREVNRFEVSASYALGGLAGGQDDARMGWLYEKFAELTLAELSGATSKQ